jgi:uncharacterized protein (DUF58 family)
VDTSKSLSHTLQPTTRERLRGALSVVTPLAWGCVATAIAAFVAGRQLGWEELTVISCVLGALLLICAALTLGRTEMKVQVDVRPSRVRAGQRAAALVGVHNDRATRSLPFVVELPVGDGLAELRVPSLGGGEEHEEVVVLPTLRRAVIPVGPATSVRSDPLGLLRRSRAWTGVVPLIVHPATISISELGTGTVRDLEGRATPDLSQADIAFHTLRAYEPGDDRRFVHPLTSARVGSLMVRQFVDTRRSHVGIVIDGSAEAYADEDELELAIAAAGSLGLQVIREEQDLSFTAAGERLGTTTPTTLLDGLAALQPTTSRRGLVAEVDGLLRIAVGMSLVFVATGSRRSVRELARCALRFAPETHVFYVVADERGEAEVRPLGTHVLLRVPDLPSLPGIVWRARW